MTGAILRVNPLVLLTVGLGSLLGSFAVRDLTVAAVALGAYALAAVLTVPSWRYPLACLALCSIAALSLVWSTWRLGGHDEAEALTAGLRIVVLAWPGSVAAGYIDPARLGDHLAQSLRLPGRFVAAFSASLQRFWTFVREWHELERSRRARGVGPSRNPLANGRYAAGAAFALLVQALRGASRTSVAMDARGFADAQRRTWAEPATWNRADVLGLVAATALALVAPVTLLLT